MNINLHNAFNIYTYQHRLKDMFKINAFCDNNRLNKFLLIYMSNINMILPTSILCSLHTYQMLLWVNMNIHLHNAFNIYTYQHRLKDMFKINAFCDNNRLNKFLLIYMSNINMILPTSILCSLHTYQMLLWVNMNIHLHNAFNICTYQHRLKDMFKFNIFEY